MTGFFSNVFDAPQAGFFGGGLFPPLPPVPDQAKAQLRDQIDQGLKQSGERLETVAPVAESIPRAGHVLGPALTVVSGLLQDPATRGWAARFLADSIGRDIDAGLNRANNAYGQQLFLDGGGMPRR